MFSHVSQVPCLPLASYRASIDGEAHVSPAAFEQCAHAILAAYREHYAACGLTAELAEEDAGDFILEVFDAIPAEILTAAGFIDTPEGFISPVATGDTDDDPEYDLITSGLAMRQLAREMVPNATLAVDRATLARFAEYGDVDGCLAVCQRQIERRYATSWWEELSRYFVAELEMFAADGNGLEPNDPARESARRQLGYGIDESGDRYELAICPICQDTLYGPHETCDVYVLTNCPEDSSPIIDASARYDQARGIDPERPTAREIINHTRLTAAERTPEMNQKTLRDLENRILRLRQFAAQDEESERADYRANAKRRRAVMIAERELRAAVLRNL